MRRKNPPSARSVKGFIIDAEKREIREARFSGLKDLQKAVGGLITTAHEIHHFDDSGFSMASSYDTVFVDDEGLLKDPQHFFFIEGGHSPFAGNGVVVGVDEEGATIDALSTKEELEEMVEFASREDVESMYLRPNPEADDSEEAQLSGKYSVVPDDVSKVLDILTSPAIILFFVHKIYTEKGEVTLTPLYRAIHAFGLENFDVYTNFYAQADSKRPMQTQSMFGRLYRKWRYLIELGYIELIGYGQGSGRPKKMMLSEKGFKLAKRFLALMEVEQAPPHICKTADFKKVNKLVYDVRRLIHQLELEIHAAEEA